MELPYQPGPGTDREMVACMNFTAGPGIYIAGFQAGAQAIMERLREQRHSQDTLVYPLVYCLRHGMELALKNVIASARDLLDESLGYPDGHNLAALWRIAKPLLARIWDPTSDPAFNETEAAVLALDRLDLSGESFRYDAGPKKKGRLPTLDPELRNLDLEALFAESSRALLLLDGADTGLREYLGYKEDMQAEARAIAAEMAAEYAPDPGDW